jgi:hypothetical protein
LVYLPLRLGDLDDISAMIEDISQDHPDRMRIVIAVNAGQCPNCDALFRPQTARRYEPKHFLQGLRPGVQRRAGPAESVFRAAHWPPDARVSRG